MQQFPQNIFKPSIQAFTLVELSMVLVIVGLLVGGILGGRSLIRTSELRAIITEKNGFVIALNAFKEKYHFLPGDLPNGYQFWGAACGTNTNTAGTGCNGNGDDRIESNGLTIVSETVLAWEHLARAGLIEGAYDGTGTVVGNDIVLSTTNIPASKFSGGYWNISIQPAEAISFPDAGGNGLLLSLGSMDADYADDSWVAGLGSLTLSEASVIDKKIDDGQASNGKLRGAHDGFCDDTGTDYYSLQASGADTVGNCILTFDLKN